jgi:glyoxylase-like metal-dependent hydrolase (beta-lactamase superfamily II)
MLSPDELQAQPQQPPDLNIPHSQSTVQVSIIDTTSHMYKFPASSFVHPMVPGWDEMDCRSYAFLIKHPSSGGKYGTLLFDLGVRKDWHNCPTTFVEGIKKGGHIIEVEKDAADILQDHGEKLEEVGGIVWSHWHFDHTGNPQRFLSTTDVIVGPGFKAAFTPAFPSVPESHVDERLWEGRELREIDFVKEGAGLKIGRFDAMDFYGDGSFYLLSTPGHTVGHISALARTTSNPPTFIFMGGDIAHQAGEFRPTSYTPLPKEISPNPVKHGRLHNAPICPGEIFAAIHPKKSSTEPFFDPTPAEGGWHLNAKEATLSCTKLSEFDAYDYIFPVIAHDNSLIDVVDFYPATANDWQVKGWKKLSHWGFLSQFDPYVQ